MVDFVTNWRVELLNSNLTLAAVIELINVGFDLICTCLSEPAVRPGLDIDVSLTKLLGSILAASDEVNELSVFVLELAEVLFHSILENLSTEVVGHHLDEASSLFIGDPIKNIYSVFSVVHYAADGMSSVADISLY